jgi:hypothetical protein
LYSIPIIYSALALVLRDFVYVGKCHTFFVEAKTVVSLSPWLGIPYSLYYAGFIFLIFISFFYAITKTHNSLQKKVYWTGLLGILLMTIPTYVLIFIFPTLNVMFPSVLCQFAIFAALLIFVGAWLDIRLQKRIGRKRL